ncbi:MAG TPA: Ig-like domain-containing protein, partial [Kofleriaceae bacterium]|nr:Ig-like domain-containing protein [Kofleriaceae bacterium]
MKRSLSSRVVALATLIPFVSLSCGGSASRTTTPTGNSPLSDQVLILTKDLPPGLDLRVSNGREGPPAFDRAKLVPAKKLDEAVAQQLLSRTKPLASDVADKQAFALRPGSKPAPRTGQVIKGQFPTPASQLLPPKASDTGKPLTVLRYMPEGAVPLAPELSVTFSQPMIAVTSQSDAAQNVPVKLTPQPKGSWRWIGTRTILFDPDVRFPQATTYRVEIPAGTKSATGGVLKDGVKFTFETPAPKLISSYPSPHGHQRLDVPMFALFDQRIDRAQVFEKIRVRANGQVQPIELVDDVSIEKDKQLAALVKATVANEQDGRWLAFRSKQPLPRDAAVDVVIGAETPSAEGPNTTKAPQQFTFRTFPPLRIQRAECGYNGECPPGNPFSIEFNNPIDADRFDDAQLAVTPDVPGLKIVQNGNYLSLMGMTRARTTYRIVVSGGVLDEFGQPLGKDTTLTWRVTD